MGKLGVARYLDDPANRGLLLKNSTGGLVHEAMGCHVYNAATPGGARAFQDCASTLQLLGGKTAAAPMRAGLGHGASGRNCTGA